MKKTDDFSARKNGARTTAAVASIGCKVNRCDANDIITSLSGAGFSIVNFSEAADVYVINTCAVTGEAAKKSRVLIKRAHAKNRNALIAVAGCLPQTEAELVRELPGVSLMFGTKEYDKIAEKIVEKLAENAPALDFVVQNDEIAHNCDERTRAYVKIQDGCENFCSYCIIPYARGAVKSRPLDEIVQNAQQLASKGFKEVVLTGIHVHSYGKDLGGNGSNVRLPEVCSAVCGVDGIERVRLSSLSPLAVNEEFVEKLAKMHKICDYFHLSLQSGSEKILRKMNRGYTPDDYRRAVSLLKKAFPSCAVWSDVITGFPGETDEDFDETVQFIQGCGIDKLHIFPFSPKKGTAAYDMDGAVPHEIKAFRAKRLKETDDEIYLRFLNKQIGKSFEVLFENSKNGCFFGHTTNYIYVKVQMAGDFENRILPIKLKDARQNEGGILVTGIFEKGGGFNER